MVDGLFLYYGLISKSYQNLNTKYNIFYAMRLCSNNKNDIL